MATRDTGNKKRGRPPKAATSEAAPEAKKASTKNGSTSDAVVGFEPTHPNQAYAAASDDDEKSPT